MKVDRVIVGQLDTNCYILSIDSDVLIIDPGDEYEKIIDKVYGKNILGILITHSHFDHVGALKYFNNTVYRYDNLSEKNYNIGKFSFDVIYTPNGIGRTDLGGYYVDMKKSLNKIKSYDNDIKIYPGHGDSSTLGEEKRRF